MQTIIFAKKVRDNNEKGIIVFPIVLTTNGYGSERQRR